MLYYYVSPATNIPTTSLIYASKVPLEIGQVVYISLKNRLVSGVVIKKCDKEPSNYQAKTIETILPIKLSRKQLNFIGWFSNYILSNVNITLGSCLRPITSLKKEMLNLATNINQKNEINTNNFEQNEIKKINYILSQKPVVELWLRIRDIIRSIILTQNTPIIKEKSNINILIILAEKKEVIASSNQIQELHSKWINELDDGTKYIENQFFIYNYLDPKQVSGQKTTIKAMEKGGNKINLFFSTKSGLFLPFNDLSQIFILDEANPLHQQDQNSLYFDSKEAGFFLAKAYNAEISLISYLPSVRLYKYYDEDQIDKVQQFYQEFYLQNLDIVLTTFSKEEKKDQKIMSQMLIEKIKPNST